MTLKFYYNFIFPTCRTVYMFLNAVKIPFEKKEVIVQGLKITGEHKSLSKLESVSLPIIEDNGFKIMESVAIIRYLSKFYPSSELLYPINSKEQARVDEYLAWQHHNTSFLCFMYFQQYLKPLLSGTTPDLNKIEPYKDRMIDSIDKIEEFWLKEQKFLTGDKLTIADIFCLNDILQTNLVGYEAQKDRPLLTAWIERVKNSLNPHYEEVHKLIPKINTTYSKQI